MSGFVALRDDRPKSGLRDRQGGAVPAALRSLGLAVDDVRTGKEIVVRFSASGLPDASAAAQRMGDELLANPVIEDYTVEVAELNEA